jgi:hypothetical protein
MFDLEQAITEWRKQMFASGIKTPVPLKELESHLREDIEQQNKSGANPQQAFEIAVQQIGQAEPLKEEFRNAGFSGWFDENKNRRISHILALFQLEYCVWGFFSVIAPILPMVDCGIIFYGPKFIINLKFFLTLLVKVIFLRGIIASILLFCGKNKEIRTIQFIAVLGLAALVAQIIAFRTGPLLAIAFNAFNVASIWLLRPPQAPKLTTA